MKTEITNEIKEALKKFFWTDENGKTMVSLGNCRLDFKKDYYFEKFTKMGVKLYWLNGDDKVYVMGKVDSNEEYKDFSLYTEGWNYIERFKLNDKEERKQKRIKENAIDAGYSDENHCIVKCDECKKTIKENVSEKESKMGGMCDECRGGNQ